MKPKAYLTIFLLLTVLPASAIRLERHPEAGLYWNIYPAETNRVHVPCGGQYVTTVCVKGKTEVSVRTEIRGIRKEGLKVTTVIVDRNTGKDVAYSSAFEVLSRTAGENGDTTVTVLQHFTVDSTDMCSQEALSLYEVNTDIYVWFHPKRRIPGRFSAAPPKMIHSDKISTVLSIYPPENRFVTVPDIPEK